MVKKMSDVSYMEDSTCSDENYTALPPSEVIKISEEAITIPVEHTANHTEISIMKSQWNSICRKINCLKTSKFDFNFKEVIIGACIPYGLDIFSSFIKGEDQSWYPLIICAVIYFVGNALSKKFNLFSDGCSTENALHINDIKETIKEINQSCNSTESHK